MTIARTKVDLILQPPVGVPDAHCIEGMVSMARNFSVTADSDTTCAIYCGGLIPWRLANESGGALTFTLYTAYEPDGTAITPYDQDDVAVATLTVGDDEDIELPTGLSGCLWLVIIAGAAADNITLLCRR